MLRQGTLRQLETSAVDDSARFDTHALSAPALLLLALLVPHREPQSAAAATSEANHKGAANAPAPLWSLGITS